MSQALMEGVRCTIIWRFRSGMSAVPRATLRQPVGRIQNRFMAAVASSSHTRMARARGGIDMTTATRRLAPVALAVGLGFGALSPQTQAQDSLTRVLVNAAATVRRASAPSYR